MLQPRSTATANSTGKDAAIQAEKRDVPQQGREQSPQRSVGHTDQEEADAYGHSVDRVTTNCISRYRITRRAASSNACVARLMRPR